MKHSKYQKNIQPPVVELPMAYESESAGRVFFCIFLHCSPILIVVYTLKKEKN